MRRFASFGYWGLVDVTDYPWCVPLEDTILIDVGYKSLNYDGTF